MTSGQMQDPAAAVVSEALDALAGRRRVLMKPSAVIAIGAALGSAVWHWLPSAAGL